MKPLIHEGLTFIEAIKMLSVFSSYSRENAIDCAVSLAINGK